MPHTPGPWKLTPRGDIETASDYVVHADIDLMDGHRPVVVIENSSDAHLIAAAPDMFEALDQIVEAVAHTTNGGVCQVSDFDFAREALAKARGEPC